MNVNKARMKPLNFSSSTLRGELLQCHHHKPGLINSNLFAGIVLIVKVLCANEFKYVNV